MSNPPNKFPGTCTECGTTVAAYDGTRVLVKGIWAVTHNECPKQDATIDLDFQSIIASNFEDGDNDDAAMMVETIDSGSATSLEMAAIYDHPVVKELQAQLAEVLQQISDFEAKATTAAERLLAAKSDKQDFLKSIEQQLAAYDQAINEAAAQKRLVDESLKKCADLKIKALSDIDHQVDVLKAQADLAVAQEQWDAVIAEHNWLWADKAWEFQKVGIQFIASALNRDLGGVALLDQMGLGKTLQARGALDLLQSHPDFIETVEARMPGFDVSKPAVRSVLWVCPSAIKVSTQRELSKWSDAPVVVLDGDPGTRHHLVNMANEFGMTLVVGYEQLRDRNNQPVTPELLATEWPIVVMDEIHRAKNRETSTFWNMRKIVQKSAFCIPMTGTPILNRPDEFWTILHFITQKGKRMGEFAKFADFERRYLSSYYGGTGHFQPGAFDSLINSVADMVIRRRKDEVLPDLPDKIREVRFVTMDGRQRELYDMMRDRLYIWLDEQKSSSISATNFLAQLTRLRQIALFPAGVKIIETDPQGNEKEVTLDCTESSKIDEAMLLVQELMEAGEKVLVFSNYNAPLHEIQRRIDEVGMTYPDSNGNDTRVLSAAIVGGQKPEDRASTVDRFNDSEDPCRVVVGNIKAMGVGLNMQGACSHAIFLDLDWTPGGNEQAEDRLHRGGQENNVTIHIIQAEETVDAFIAQKLEQKQGLIEGMIERDELRRALDEGLI